MTQKTYFDFVLKYIPYIALIIVLDIIIALWWSYFTFQREFTEWIFFRATKYIFTICVLDIFIIHLFYLFLKEKTKYIVYIFSLLATFIFLLQVYLLVFYYSKLNVIMIDILLQTDIKEIYEFIQVYINYKIVISVIVFYTLIMVFLLMFYKIKPKIYVQNKVKNFLCIFYVLVIIILFVDIANRYFVKHQGKYSFDKLNFSFVIDIPIQFVEYYGKNGLWTNYKFYLTNYEKVANLYKNKVILKEKIPYIVFIVGESTQRNYMSLYGYELNTTPNLKNLEQSGNLIKFSDTIASFASTQASLRRVLNFSNIENEENWQDRLNVVDLFNLAGYRSIFISNHEPMSGHTSITTAVANRAHKTIFLNQFINDDKILSKALDTEMLPLVKKELDDKDFFILQLMGTHANYKRRYEKEFDKFNFNDIKRNLSQEKKQEVAEYANAVLYNDYFVNEIFNIFKDKDAIIIYISDHGESVFEYRDRAEHFVTSKFTAEIPFFFIMSDNFKNNHPEIVERILVSKDKPFMTDDLIHTLSAIGGIYVKDYDEKRDIINDAFNTNRIRFFNGDVDYDKVLKSEKSKY
ncbi:sulfatase-like hydrolase/transferase [Campylobacter insulaenigrae]|uniref:phosphoethanolamine transferase n=1 Tax=Campylobacter insulaenigrae TaxID=260714 RepID=UPI002152EAE8|nr:sulfatase-like hydrolase/transferase [Campylobacter insulaenigrae]MCR6576177.1 sulfatase-like hydrolase/transferase [Campylobacter insulaenigrae]MCR6577008.1 sulfatase-like hydrolase/transferase [Campylobacter insulaenigrae]MCR6584921.1 sulfatase-like hydrolase/transferase [Campylobacter insulaenigrae]